jgi:hypothetical protein
LFVGSIKVATTTTTLDRGSSSGTRLSVISGLRVVAGAATLKSRTSSRTGLSVGGGSVGARTALTRDISRLWNGHGTVVEILCPAAAGTAAVVESFHDNSLDESVALVVGAVTALQAAAGDEDCCCPSRASKKNWLTWAPWIT